MAALDLIAGYSTTEALGQVRSLLNEPTASYWTNDELNKWVQEACVDISSKTLCVEKKDTIALATNTMEYTALETLGAGAIADIIKVHAVIYNDDSTTYKGLVKIHPRQIAHLPDQAASGVPSYYYHFGATIGFFPIPSSSENAHSPIVYFSISDETITNLPIFYQLAAIYYAVSMARKKQKMIAEANQFYTMYANSMVFNRADLYDPGAESKDMFQIPDRAVAVGR